MIPRKILIILFLILSFVFIIVKFFPKLKSNENFDLGIEEETKKKIKKIKTEDLKVPLLKLNLLEENYKEEVFSIGRNIFKYGPPKTYQASQLVGQNINRENLKAPPKVISEPLSESSSLPTNAERQQKKEPPNFTYKYLGFFGPVERKLAVFSDGKDIIDLFEGEILAEKFILKKIGYESVTIGFVGFSEEYTKQIEVGQ
mgnify:CR=1 FL=1